MKIEIGNKNKIKKSNIGTSNKILNGEPNNKKIPTDIIVGILVTVIGGIILYFIINFITK